MTGPAPSGREGVKLQSPFFNCSSVLTHLQSNQMHNCWKMCVTALTIDKFSFTNLSLLHSDTFLLGHVVLENCNLSHTQLRSSLTPWTPSLHEQDGKSKSAELCNEAAVLSRAPCCILSMGVNSLHLSLMLSVFVLSICSPTLSLCAERHLKWWTDCTTLKGQIHWLWSQRRQTYFYTWRLSLRV